jgi:hypothetical protein
LARRIPRSANLYWGTRWKVAYLNHQIRREELIGSSGPNPFTARKILLMLLVDERPTTDRRR